MSSFSRQQLELYLKNLEINAKRVLDVGGAQLPIRTRLKSFQCEEYGILDLEQPHQGDPKIVKYAWDLNKPVSSLSYIDGQFSGPGFDVVFCIEVMEYIYNPLAALNTLYELLDFGGVLYITFQFVYPQHEPFESDYLRYTKQGALRLLREAGFVEMEVVARETSQLGKLGKLYTSEGMRPSKNPEAAHEDVAYIIKAYKK